MLLVVSPRPVMPLFEAGQVPVADPVTVEEARRALGIGVPRVRYGDQPERDVSGLAEDLGLR